MRSGNLKFGLFVAVLAAGLGAAVFAQGQAGQPPAGRGQGRGGAPQNLQVLPKDWTLQQVQAQMRTFAASLGVECTHCHIGGMADRSKDDNPRKNIARQMIRMTNSINTEMLKGVGEPAAAGMSKVTCFTCHRGAIKPLNAPSGGN